MTVAVLSMDVEDWYHLDYFRQRDCERETSLLDGLDVYRSLLAGEGLRSSFFVVGELVGALRDGLRQLHAEGHELGVHGWNHARPLTMSPEGFAADLRRSKDALEGALGARVAGYRAPCFSLDRKRLDLVREAGFTYDSSRILFSGHPLYGTLDLGGFEPLSANIFRKGPFFEFQVSTLARFGRNIPVSGGGYLRLLPWPLMRCLVTSYLRRNELYVLYIHPFELSPRPSPPMPNDAPWAARARFRHGRRSTPGKLRRLLALLKKKGVRFTTFADLRNELLQRSSGTPEHG
jgi:polysaccharide deacetylase family protein (PEP-CTERM system associated)